MASQPEALRDRTKPFAIRIVKLFRALPKAEVARVLGKQVLRSGTSVAFQIAKSLNRKTTH